MVVLVREWMSLVSMSVCKINQRHCKRFGMASNVVMGSAKYPMFATLHSAQEDYLSAVMGTKSMSVEGAVLDALARFCGSAAGDLLAFVKAIAEMSVFEGRSRHALKAYVDEANGVGEVEPELDSGMMGDHWGWICLREGRSSGLEHGEALSRQDERSDPQNGDLGSQRSRR